MQMKKFIAATAREAMRKMKADLGNEAYVISNRKTAQGIEILAMAGNAMEHLTQSAQGAPPRASVRTQEAMPAAGSALAAPHKTLRDIAVRIPAAALAARLDSAQAPRTAMTAQKVQAASANTRRVAAAAATADGPAETLATAIRNDPSVAAPVSEQRLLDEFRSMKNLLESRLSAIAGHAAAAPRPLAVTLWRELTLAGYSPGIARAISSRVPDDFGETEARQWLRDVLARNLHCALPENDLVMRGGIYALTGPTGVGKTTTVAKLAARCVVRYGAASLGLVTTDGYRIGAFDQLEIYGRILGVPVHAAQTASDLEAVLAALRGKRLVLIDTVGMGQRDARLEAHMDLLNVAGVRRVLLLNAVAQAETLDDVVRAYLQVGQVGQVGQTAQAGGQHPPQLASTGIGARQPVILTKLDEAVKLAPVLDACTRHALEIQYITSGQRVPEDIHQANARALAHRSLHAVTSGAFMVTEHEWAAHELPATARPAGTVEMH